MPRYFRHVVLALPALLVLTGCGGSPPAPPPPTVPVAGKVYSPSGAPVTAGRVVFKPKAAGGQEGVAEIAKDGSYKLTSYREGDGAVAGEYTVVVEPVSYKTGSAVAVKADIPKKYQGGSSDLVIAVKEGQSDYPIRLK